MRGKADSNRIRRNRNRITPAYAGKSAELYQWGMDNGDHPRLCGEKKPSWSGQACMAGSPPPMRGKAVRHAVSVADHGITPAYAGKRFDAITVPDEDGDHPRLCGEKGKIDETVQRIMGSPPPMRGKD